jgi:hypothetical protein
VLVHFIHSFPFSFTSHSLTTSDCFSGQHIYVSDAADFTIERVDLFTEERTVIIDTGLQNVEGLHYDTRTGVLYWTDESARTISACRASSPHIRRVLVAGNMSHPRAIVVAGETMYWSDWAQHGVPGAVLTGAKIERAALNGTSRTVLVSTGLLDWNMWGQYF